MDMNQTRVEYYEETIMEMVDDKAFDRDDMAKFYAWMIFEQQVFKRKVKAKEVNDKILTRYKISGLNYIKEKAWKIYAEMRK